MTVTGDRVLRNDAEKSYEFIMDTDQIMQIRKHSIKNILTVFILTLSVFSALALFLCQNQTELRYALIFTAASAGTSVLFIIISRIYLKLSIKRLCSDIKVYTDRFSVGEEVFLFSKINDAWMTPFEYYDDRIISFRYNGKRYKFRFGRYSGINKPGFSFGPYAALNSILERNGFSSRY